MTLVSEKATVLQNKKAGPRLYFMELESPRIAPLVQPGQFIHMQLNGLDDHILRRPFSVFDADAQSGRMTVLYQVVGTGTQFMTQVSAGHTFDLIGSVGRGWTLPTPEQRVLLVGGGVGAAPLFMLCKSAHAAGAVVDVVIGAATKDALVTYDFYKRVQGDALYCATDDGSFGSHGFCTGPAGELLQKNSYDQVYVCGPEPLMHALAKCAKEAAVPCQVSLEKRMACGVGACLSCVVETTQGRRRACVDGPIFEAEKVVW